MPFFGGGGGDYHIVATNIKGGTGAAPAVTGTNNMALGNASLNALTTGVTNLGIGNNAGKLLTIGNDNIAIGEDDTGVGTLGSAARVNRCIAIGYNALAVLA